MTFAEICVYQVKPDKVDEFESIMTEAKPFLKESGAFATSSREAWLQDRYGAD